MKSSLFTFFVALLLASGLTACDNRDEPTGGEGTMEEQTEPTGQGEADNTEEMMEPETTDQTQEEMDLPEQTPPSGQEQTPPTGQ
jgi:hypothetical protein